MDFDFTRRRRLSYLEIVKQSLLQISFFLVALLLLNACSHKGIYTKGYYARASGHKPAVVPPQRKRDADYHVVEKGETLYSIAWQNGYDHRQLAGWNGIKPPYTIFPLQRIRIKPRAMVTSPRQSSSRTKSKKAYIAPNKPATNLTKKPTWTKKPAWYWPAQGPLLSTFSHNDAGRKGVDISGRLGQPVQAAADGKVVYSGSGLRGYGNLIIVKHNEEFFSAYAHNNKNLVKENQSVKARQRIADMGRSGTDRVKLHFEIRRDGKPVNPLSYLPKHQK